MSTFRAACASLTVAVAVLLPGWLHSAPAGVRSDRLMAAERATSIPGQTAALPPLEEQLLAEKDASAPANDAEDTFSPDGRHVAWRTRLGEKWAVLLDGRPEAPRFDEISWIIFSSDGRRLAYRGRQAGKWTAVVDGTPLAAGYDEIRRMRFSPDGAHLAFAAKKGGKWRLVVDGTDRPGLYDDMPSLTFSPDANHLAAIAKKNGKWLLVADDKETPPYDNVDLFMFSPDSRRFAYVAVRKGWRFVVLDGQEGPEFDIIGGPVFSRDGKRFAYSGVKLDGNKGNGLVVVDGEQGPLFRGGDPNSVGKTLLTGKTLSLVPGSFDTLWPPWHGVSEPSLSPDGRRVVFAGRRAKDDVVAVIDGQPGPSVEAILDGPHFSADGQHVAYLAKANGALVTVVDGTRLGEFPAGSVDLGRALTISPDGRRVAVVAVWGGSWFHEGLTFRARQRVFVDGQAGTEYNADWLINLRFSPDSRHIAYEAHDIGDNVSLVVVNGVETKRYDSVGMRSMRFDGNSALTWNAQAGRRFYLVRQALER